MLIDRSSYFHLCKYSQADAALNDFRISNVCFHIFSSSHTCLMSLKILSNERSVSPISIIPEQITFEVLRLQILRDLTSFTSQTSQSAEISFSLLKPKGVWFVSMFKHCFAIGTVVNMTKIENMKVHIGSIIIQFV